MGHSFMLPLILVGPYPLCCSYLSLLWVISTLFVLLLCFSDSLLSTYQSSFFLFVCLCQRRRMFLSRARRKILCLFLPLGLYHHFYFASAYRVLSPFLRNDVLTTFCTFPVDGDPAHRHHDSETVGFSQYFFTHISLIYDHYPHSMIRKISSLFLSLVLLLVCRATGTM
jgi:hypothetical protein